MTSTLASMRRLSVRVAADTVDLAVPIGTRMGDLLASGGFPPGSHLVDASGAALPDDDRVGDVFEDGAIVYVVDSSHTPSLTRVTPAAPSRNASAPGGPPGRAADPAPAGPGPAVGGSAPAPSHAAQVQVDRAAAGSRTRSAGRRAARGRPGTAPGTAPRPDTGAADGADRRSADARREDRPTPDAAAGARTASDPGPAGADGVPARRPAVAPPVVRRAPGAGTGAGAGLLPPPPGPGRATVPLPPGRTAGRAAHAARHGAETGTSPAGRTTELARRGGGVAVPPPPRVAPPPSGATGRGALGPRGSHRAAGEPEPAPRPKFAGPAEVTLSAGALAVPMVLSGACALLVLLATVAGGLPTWATWASGAALLLSGVVAAVRPGADSLRRWGRVAAVAVGGSGGFVLAVSLEVDLPVAAVCGLVVGTAVAMLGRVAAIRQGVFDPWITVVAVATGAVGVDVALAIALSWPPYVGPLLLAGVAPLVMRALPALSLDVPEEQLVDTERLSNTSWSARTGVKRKRRALRQASVELITLRASGIVAAGTVVVAAFVSLGYGFAVLSTPPSQIARWALLAEGVLLLGGLGLAARTVRARFGKRVLRLTAAVVTLETGYYFGLQVGEGTQVTVVVLLVVLAGGVIAIGQLLGTGWQSLRLSRLADTVEGFCVVFALPAALLAVDAIEVLRQAAS